MREPRRTGQQLHDVWGSVLYPAAIGAGAVPMQCWAMGRGGDRVLRPPNGPGTVLCLVNDLAWVAWPLLDLRSGAHVASVRRREHFALGHNSGDGDQH